MLYSVALVLQDAFSMWRTAPDTVDPRRVSIILGTMIHGPSGISERLRDSIVADEEIIAFIAALLRGDESLAERFNTATALWWIGESGDPDYLPLLLEYSRLDPKGHRYAHFVALWGLARYANASVARERLWEVITGGSDLQREQVALYLLRVNSPASRWLLLRVIDAVALPTKRREQVRRVLAAPPLPHPGRSCVAGQTFGRRPRGAYGCVQAPETSFQGVGPEPTG